MFLDVYGDIKNSLICLYRLFTRRKERQEIEAFLIEQGFVNIDVTYPSPSDFYVEGKIKELEKKFGLRQFTHPDPYRNIRRVVLNGERGRDYCELRTYRRMDINSRDHLVAMLVGFALGNKI